MNKIPYKEGYELSCAFSYLDDTDYTCELIKNKVGANPMLVEFSHVTNNLFECVCRSNYPLPEDEILAAVEPIKPRKNKGVYGALACFAVLCAAQKHIVVLDSYKGELLVIDAENEYPFVVKNWSALLSKYPEIYSIDVLMHPYENRYAPYKYQPHEYMHIVECLNLPRPAPVT